LGVEPTATLIAELYADFVKTVLVDETDAALVAGDSRFAVRNTVMRTPEHRIALARECIALIDRLRQ
jgi:hypothetical protein